MNINLANIDFVPGQGGGGEAVIQSLDVTENGTYSAPSGVDGYNPVKVNVSGGSSITPEEQDALNTLVDSSDGVLYTDVIEGNKFNYKPWSGNFNLNMLFPMVDGSIYLLDFPKVYKWNPETMNFEFIVQISSSTGNVLWIDNSGRLFQGRNKEIDLTTGSITDVNLNWNNYAHNRNRHNLLYGDRGIWCVEGNVSKLYDEQLKQFTGTYTTTLPQDYSGNIKYDIQNVFTYKGHKLFHTNTNKTYEVVETNDGLTVTDVTGVYFPIPTTFNITDPYFIFSTENGNLYYIYNIDDKYIYTGTGTWETLDIPLNYYFNSSYAVSGNYVLGGLELQNQYSILNFGPTQNITSWISVNNVAVDLKSDQLISGYKTFKNETNIDRLNCSVIRNNNSLEIYSNNKLKTISSNIIFSDINGKETFIKNGSKPIVTVDQIFINNTFIPYGKDGDTININGSSYSNYNFNTYTNRLFKEVGNDWFEFDGTSTLIPVSFISNLYGPYVCNSPNMTIAVVDGNTYIWNDKDTRFDLICSSNNIDWACIWFDGDNFRFQNEYKLVETDSVWNWISDPLLNNIWDYNYNFGYKDGEVYAYNQVDYHLYKYNKVNCTLDKIGYLNAGKLYSYFNEMFFRVNGPDVYIIDLSKVDPQNPDAGLFGDKLFSAGGDTNDFIGATDRLWYYNSSSEMCSSYQYIYETPEVPASDGTYSLKAVRSGDQITYNWVLDA